MSQTLLQTLTWTSPPALPITLPPLGDPRRNTLSLSDLVQRLSMGGTWQLVGMSLNWFTYAAPGLTQNVRFTPMNPGETPWTSAMQSQLHDSYAAHLHWYLTNFKPALVEPPSPPGPTRTGIVDAPQNLAAATPGAMYPFTLISGDAALAMFLNFAGNSLAVEQLGVLPWSLINTPDIADNFEAFADLFDALRLFGDPGYPASNIQPGQYMLPWATPCPAVVAAKFIQHHGLVCGSILESIGKLLRWCKILKHREVSPDGKAASDTDGFQWSGDFFGYRGAPLVESMLNGFVYLGTDASIKAAFPGLGRWTLGCHSTAVLLQTVLRAMNIPAFCVDFTNLAWTGSVPINNSVWGQGHEASYFRTAGRVLAHADHPYDVIGQILNPSVQNPSTLGCDILPFPGEALTVPASEFLPMASAPKILQTDILSRPIARLMARYLTQTEVLKRYHLRKGSAAAGGLPAVAGQPAGSPPPSFDAYGEGPSGSGALVPSWQAEELGTTARLDALVEPYLADVGDVRIKNDLDAIPFYEDVIA
jgi:hypothetical protein